MNIKTRKINNLKLSEGKTFPFKISKKISLDDNEEYYLLIDPLGYKTMLPAGFYKKYGFKAGQTLLCRVDKINCNGQVFLEPEHPFYKENEKYEFIVVESGVRKNIMDEDENYWIVNDLNNRKWTVIASSEVNNNLIKSEKITCYVERIKKGKIFLRLDDKDLYSTKLKVGKEYDFQVINEKRHPEDGLSYYILKGPDNTKHLLKQKYYKHYNIKTGDTIACRVIRFSPKGGLLLEPKNPAYNIGDAYGFKITRFEELIFSDGFKQKVIVLEDAFHDLNNVFVEEKEFQKYKDQKTARAIVNNINKSRLDLELI